MAKKKRAATAAQPDERSVCFIIMPISELEGRSTDHFRKVYRQIFEPACEAAGYRAVRADDIRQSNLIHIDLLDKIINAPMAICDLSTLNPNVMFELGVRQAFDKRVVLVREKGTKDVFDIGPLRFTEYRKERIHDELIEDVEGIKQSIEATRDSTDGVNSIVRLLSVAQAATIPPSDQTPVSAMMEMLRSDIASLKSELAVMGRRTTVFPDVHEAFGKVFADVHVSSDSKVDPLASKKAEAARRIAKLFNVSTVLGQAAILKYVQTGRVGKLADVIESILTVPKSLSGESFWSAPANLVHVV